MGEQGRYRLRSAILLAALIGLPAWAIVGNPWDEPPAGAPSVRRAAPGPSGDPLPPAEPFEPQPLAEPQSPAETQPPTVARASFAEESAADPPAASTAAPRSVADEYAQRASHGAYRWEEIQRQLRELGATYYLLETWGPSGEQFRFHCQVAVAGNASYARSFEAVGVSAVEAMEEVLEQVELWRAGDAP